MAQEEHAERHISDDLSVMEKKKKKQISKAKELSLGLRRVKTKKKTQETQKPNKQEKEEKEEDEEEETTFYLQPSCPASDGRTEVSSVVPA